MMFKYFKCIVFVTNFNTRTTIAVNELCPAEGETLFLLTTNHNRKNIEWNENRSWKSSNA